MINISKKNLIWLFAILIILETIWLDFRLQTLKKQSAVKETGIDVQEVLDNLKKVPEPKIEEEVLFK